MKQKAISRAEEAVLKFYFETKNIYTIGISPSEEAALKRMGYDPKSMVCVERFDDESVFTQITVSKPVCVGLNDGGGMPHKFPHHQLMPPVKTSNTELEEIKRQHQEIEQQHQEILARIEAIEAKRQAR